LIEEMNDELGIIGQVVVHPKYRTIGLGPKLIKDTLSYAGTPLVENGCCYG
jgi:predicted GNAT family acetyltransferase